MGCCYSKTLEKSIFITQIKNQAKRSYFCCGYNFCKADEKRRREKTKSVFRFLKHLTVLKEKEKIYIVETDSKFRRCNLLLS